MFFQQPVRATILNGNGGPWLPPHLGGNLSRMKAQRGFNCVETAKYSGCISWGGLKRKLPGL